MHEWQTPEYEARAEADYERIRARHPTLVTKSFRCYAGWHGIIEDYFDEVARLLAEQPGATYSLRQVKEKFAALRLYAGCSDDIRKGVTAAYDRAQELSYQTCEVCGQPGAVRRRGNWYSTRCEAHADGAAAVTGIGGEEV